MNNSSRFTNFDIQRSTEEIYRSFPNVYLEVSRSTLGVDAERQTVRTPTIIWKGTALIRPTSGQIVRAPMGEQLPVSLTVLIPGKYDIRQGDFATVSSILYQIDFPPDWLGSFLQLNLKRFQQ